MPLSKSPPLFVIVVVVVVVIVVVTFILGVSVDVMVVVVGGAGGWCVMIWTLWVIGLVSPQYVSLIRLLSYAPFVSPLVYSPCLPLIYDNTPLSPFQLCLPVSCLVSLSL